MLREYLDDNLILVIPNEIKINILKEISSLDSLYRIKVMSLNELVNACTFSYDEKSIYYLIDKYNMNYDVANMYLKNIKYVHDIDYEYDKLTKLKLLKKELLDNNLLIIDKNFNEFLRGKKILIYGYDNISKFDRKVLDELDIPIQVVNRMFRNFDHDIYEFNHIDDEVSFVASKIFDLVENGININNIYLSNVTSEYFNVIERIFKMYEINVNLNNQKSIISSNIVYDFLELINNNDINSAINMINEKYNMNNDENLYIVDNIIKIINKYNFVQEKNVLISILIEELKKVKYKKKINKNAVNMVDICNNNITDDDYIFLLGFNMGNIPIIFKDEEYITDNIKSGLDIETTREKNVNNKISIINNIRNTKNLFITYKLKTNFDNYMKSQLVDELNYNLIVNPNIPYNYSNTLNKLALATKLDNLIKYGIKDEKIDVLYNNYKDIEYLKYNNKFTGINKEKLVSSLNNKLLLSYSSIDNYYRCNFRYYINNILKLTEFEESFAQFIGSLFHDILSKSFNENFDFDMEFNNYIKDKELNSKDEFFIEKLKDELKFIIESIKKQNKFGTLDKALYENKIYINKDGNIKLTFMGIIDKLLYKEENNKTYLVIIDYKTGFPHINLNNVFYGINMQLPVYLYLTKKGLFNNAEVIGFYLQKILNTEIVRNTKKTYESQKKDNLKLQGYTIDNPDIINKFDSTFKDSEVIKSLRFGTNGFYKYSKTISREKIEELIDIVEKNIDKAFNDILDAKFDINPKRIGKENLGCEFCKYSDICYMSEEDVVNLEEKVW